MYDNLILFFDVHDSKVKMYDLDSDISIHPKSH